MINLVAQSRKACMFGPSILPVTAILDPELTLGLPPKLTAWTGIDALNHPFLKSTTYDSKHSSTQQTIDR